MSRSVIRQRGVLIHIPFLPLLVAGLLLSIGCAPRSAADAPLSAEEITTLRERYPTMSVVYEPTVDVLPYNLEKDLSLLSQAFVEVEVLEQLDDFHRSGTLNPFEGVDPAVLAEKEKNLGHPIPTEAIRQQHEVYRLRVVDILCQGDRLDPLEPSLALTVGQELIAGSMVHNYGISDSPLPEMAPGSRWFVPISIGDPYNVLAFDYRFRTQGLYYIVGGTHVLSAYQEREPHLYTGLPCDTFRQTIRSILEENAIAVSHTS